jgi:hypothetical protein
MDLVNFKSKGMLPSGFEVEFGILKNKHLVELQKRRKNSANEIALIDIVAEVTHRIGETTKVTKTTIGLLTPIDFKQLLCLIRQNTFDYPEEVEQKISYEVENGKFEDFTIKEEVEDGEFAFEYGKIAYNNGFKKEANGKINTVLKEYKDLDRDYMVKIGGSKRRKALNVRMTAPPMSMYMANKNEDIVTIINQRNPSIKKESGWVRLNIADLPMNTSAKLMKLIEENEGAVHTQTQFTHPYTGNITTIDFTDYPEFLLGK